MNSLKSVLALGLVIALSGCNLTLNLSGQGEITVSGGTPKQCASTFSNCLSFNPSEEISLSPIPAEGYYFSHWEGDCSGRDTCTLKMNSTRQVRAVFLSPNLFQPEFKPNTDHFFSAPWPNDAYNLTSAGYVDVKEFPFDSSTSWDSQIKSLAKKTRGFSTNGGSFFQFATDIPDFSDDSFNQLAIEKRPYLLVNVDSNSPNFGKLIPSQLASYNRQDIDHESNHMMIVVPQPGYPLDANTTYAAVLMKPIISKTSAAPLLEGLDEPYSSKWSISETLFNTLRFQKNQIAAAVQLNSNWQSSDFMAFTYFTTQDPIYITRAIGNTLKALPNNNIVASVTNVTQLQECACDGPTCVEAFQLTTEAPTFLNGNAPYLFNGGDIEISEEQAKILGSHTLEILAKVPCEEVPTGGFPLIAHAHSTTDGWYEGTYTIASKLRRAIEVDIDAPESTRRLSPASETFSNFLSLIGIHIDYLLEIITDFNVLNLNGALGTHHQYAADLFYAELVGERLAEILVSSNAINPDNLSRYQANPEQHVISGRSLGGIAAIHTLAMGTKAKMATIEKPPRPSYIHIKNIVDFIVDAEGGLETQLINISGINPTHARFQPLSHLVQTVMEPMDTLNYVKFLNIPNLFLILSKENDDAHGGEAAFSLATALENSTRIQPIYSSQYHQEDPENTLSNYMAGAPLFNGYSGYNNGNGNQFISVEDGSLSNSEPTTRLEKCFAHDTFAKPIYDTSANMVRITDYLNEPLCN